VSAAAPNGSEFQVNNYTTNKQYGPSIASDSAGNFVVVWSSYGQDGDSYGVFGQRYDAAGAPQGGEFQVNTYTTGGQGFPAVASDASGNFVVVWTSDGEDGSQGGIFAQRYDASGTPRGSEFRVNTYTTGWQSYPSVASDHAGNFVVVWNSYGQDGDAYGVFAQRYDASGAPRGDEFQVNTYTTSHQMTPSVASDAAGNFVVVWQSYWQDGQEFDVFARRFDASGVPRGAEFRVNTNTIYQQEAAAVAADAAGNFVVAWQSLDQDGDATGIFAQRFDSSAPQGAEFQVNTYTTSYQEYPSVAADAAGNFVVAWQSDGQDGAGRSVFARRYDAAGTPRGAELQVNTYTTSDQLGAAVASDSAGNLVVAWHSLGQDGDTGGIFGQRYGGLVPTALVVDDVAGTGSDGNSLLEPGETVDVKPSWTNLNGVAQTFASVSAFTGPTASGVSYSLPDGTGAYGTVANGATAQCTDCFQVAVGFTGTRPALHWDAILTETITPDALGQAKPWKLHVGESFTDVPKASGYYRFIETLLHNGVTGGCTASTYCPASSVTREQMSVFALVTKEGAGYGPPACTTPMYGDVPASSPYCRFIEELSRRGVVAGCGGGNYCPAAEVTREQMPVFMLRTLDPALTPPDCTTPMFGDVPASSPYCKWIEELARRGVVTGCGSGNYCPASAVTREQMGVFISATFGLTLYGP
jgi:hypothetical protein